MIADLFGLVVILEGPDAARVVVAVDVMVVEALEAFAVIDEAAGDGTEVGVIVLDDRHEDRRRPAWPFGPERMGPFENAPAVVAALLDLVNLLPQVLADVAAPEIARALVEAHL